jgi:hypothetical protein
VLEKTVTCASGGQSTFLPSSAYEAEMMIFHDQCARLLIVPIRKEQGLAF